jgi:hypothetical protein
MKSQFHSAIMKKVAENSIKRNRISTAISSGVDNILKTKIQTPQIKSKVKSTGGLLW